MALTRTEALREKIPGAVEVDKPDPGLPVEQQGSVGRLEGGTGEDGGSAGGFDFAHPVLDGQQPGFAVVVGQRGSGPHFGHVGGRMKIISVVEFPTQTGGELASHRTFAGPRDTHDDQDHGREGRNGMGRS